MKNESKEIDELEIVKRDAMVELLVAIDTSLGARQAKWAAEAQKFSPKRSIINPKKIKQDAQNVAECRIRISEIQNIRDMLKQSANRVSEERAKQEGGAPKILDTSKMVN